MCQYVYKKHSISLATTEMYFKLTSRAVIKKKITSVGQDVGKQNITTEGNLKCHRNTGEDKNQTAPQKTQKTLKELP